MAVPPHQDPGLFVERADGRSAIVSTRSVSADTAVYSGLAANYQLVQNAECSWTITKLR